MAVRYPITLSVSEPNNNIGLLKIRQADEETQTLVVEITENSLPKSYEGLQVFFCAKLGQSTGLGIIEQKLKPEEMTSPKLGKLEYTMRAEDWQQIGRQTAYFSFRKMTDDHTYVEQFSTRDFYYNVIKNVFSDGIKEVRKDGSTYVWTFEDLLRLFREYMSLSKEEFEELLKLLQEYMESSQADFEEWYNEIKDQLSEDAAGNLMLLYQSLRDKTGKDSDFREFEDYLSFMKRIFNEQIERSGFNVKWTVGNVDPEKDITSEIQEIVNNYSEVHFPPGVYTINGLIKIPSGKKITLSSGTTVIKRHDINNQPIFWLSGNGSALVGANMNESVIQSNVSSPLGVVLIGSYGELDTEGKNSNYNTITKLTVSGKGPLNESLANTAIMIYAPQINNLTAYFNLITDTKITNANAGILFKGWANANIINNIHFYKVGNEKYFGLAALSLLEINTKSPLENNISSVFHHQSTNADTIRFDGKSINYNSFVGINSEPGGPLARWLYVTPESTGSGNFITGSANTANGGTSFPQNFGLKNTTSTLGSIRTENAIVDSLSASAIASKEMRISDFKYMVGFKNIENLKEKQQYEILKLVVPPNLGTLEKVSIKFKISISLKSGHGFTAGTAEMLVYMFSQANKSYLEGISSTGSVNIFCQPAINGREVVIAVQMPSNGTSTQTYSYKANVELEGFGVENSELIFLENEVSGNKLILGGKPLTTISGNTLSRPNIGLVTGDLFFDQTLGKPIFFNGSSWVDANGTSV